MDPIRIQLAADHRVLDDLLGQLLHDARVLSHEHLQLAWCELEHRLLSHLDVEEQFLLPLLDASHHAAVERALAEHAHLREMVARLGVSVELHKVAADSIEELKLALQTHAEHEDRLLYRFACERASAAVQYRMATNLRAASRSAHDAALRTLAHRSSAHAASPAHAEQPRKSS